MASPPFVHLSEGAIQEILDEACPPNPVVKILSIKKIKTKSEQYRVEIYDGRQSAKCMLSNNLNSKVNTLREQTVVSLDKYGLMIINHKRFIFILQLSTLDETNHFQSQHPQIPATSQPVPSQTPLHSSQLVPSQTPLHSFQLVPSQTPLHSFQPVPSQTHLHSFQPVPSQTPLHSFQPVPSQTHLHSFQPVPSQTHLHSSQPVPSQTPLHSPTQSYPTTPSQSYPTTSSQNYPMTPTKTCPQSYPMTPSMSPTILFPTMTPTKIYPQSSPMSPTKTPTMSPTISMTPTTTPTKSYPSSSGTPSRPIQRVTNRRSSSCIPVAELKPLQPRWTIRATVTAVRELREFDTSRRGKVFSVHLTDESGTIKAAGFDEDAERLFPQLEINEVYFVSNGSIRTANKRYSSLKNDYEILFNKQTEVRKASSNPLETP